MSRILSDAVAAVDPFRLVTAASSRGVLDPLGQDPLHVVAAGKAAWPMLRAFVQLAGERVRQGVVATAGTPPAGLPGSLRWFDAGHPFPDTSSVEAGRQAVQLAAEVTPDEWLVVLLSGGASAMLAQPAHGVTLEDKVETARALMRAGVPIAALNCVRKHLSAVKGGLLGAAASRSLTLAISDVHAPIADDPAVIASGPTVADPSTFRDALGVIQGVGGVPAAVRRRFERGARGEVPETVKPGDLRLASAFYDVIGSRLTALQGAERSAHALGYAVVMVPDATAGEAREAVHGLLATARRAAATSDRSVCVLAAGETTVRVTGSGRGGRNQELALAATPVIGSLGRPALLASIGTDGIDGPTDAAGAVVDSSTLDRARHAGLEWASALARNDAYPFFDSLGDLVRWGPTGTNVGDLQVILIGADCDG